MCLTVQGVIKCLIIPCVFSENLIMKPLHARALRNICLVVCFGVKSLSTILDHTAKVPLEAEISVLNLVLKCCYNETSRMTSDPSHFTDTRSTCLP